MSSDDSQSKPPGSSRSSRRRRRRRRPRRGGGEAGDQAAKPSDKDGQAAAGDKPKRSRSRRSGRGGDQRAKPESRGESDRGGEAPERKKRRRRRRRRSKRPAEASTEQRTQPDGAASPDSSRQRVPRSEGRGRQRSRGSSRRRREDLPPALVEDRAEAIPTAAEMPGSGPGGAAEVTLETLARWEAPAAALDEDGDDVFAELAEGEDDSPPSRGKVANVAYVRVPTSTRLQDFDAGELSLRRGDVVIVQGDRGQAMGTVVAPAVRVAVPDGLSRRVAREATEHDRINADRSDEKGLEAIPYARDRVRERKLPMKLTRVQYMHGGSKAIFYFSAEGRVDFRELVKDLAQRLRTRIEMRQIGVRDEAKMVGGIGVCGLRLCCHRHLTKFEPVSIRMAKDQNLVLNPQKVSGQCGRLKCCLAYEQEIYREKRKGMPKLGKFVETPNGIGKVIELDILSRRVRVSLNSGGAEMFSADDVSPAPPPPRR